MGVGSETKVLRRIPIGEGVMVILIESSISESSQNVGGMHRRYDLPETINQPSGSAK